MSLLFLHLKIRIGGLEKCKGVADVCGVFSSFFWLLAYAEW